MDTMTNGNAVQVQQGGYVAVGGDVPEAGAIVWWRLSGDVQLERLREEWVTRGLSEELLPAGPTASSALRRSLQELGEKRRLVRPLEGHSGWALVTESTLGDTLDYQVELRATLCADDSLIIRPSFHPEADRVQAAYYANRGRITQGDVAGWLCRMVHREVDAVALRDTGGVYFVPRHALEKWRLMTGAIRAASAHVVLGVPALAVEETIDAVIDAVTAEAEREAERTEAQVLEGLGARALETRMRETGKLEEKLARYEGILGKRLEDVRARVMRVQAGVAAAMLVATADAE